MEKKLHFDPASEREATDIGAKFMHSSDVVGDMSRAYGRDLSSVRIHTDESAARGAAERGVDAFSTGKDVFFARGAFDRSDPASRGLLAHELSHSMQQGVGGGAPALTQSAPMGAAQGGLREWFKGLFGKSGDAEDSAPEQDTDTSDMDAQLTQDNDPRKELDDAAEALRTSKKWGWSQNTDKFERVSSAIDASIGQLSAPLSGDLTQDQGVLDDIIASFDDLIGACDDYLGRSSRTDRGKHRQAIVRQVRELAVKDRGGFVRYRMTPDEGEHFTSAMDVLTKSRQRTLQLMDKKEAELQHVGGAASYLARIDKGMLTDRDTSGFFKEDEVYTHKTDTGNTEQKLDALQIVGRRMALTDEQYAEIETAIKGPGIFHAANYLTDRTIHDACDLVVKLSQAKNIVGSNFHRHMKEGESLNLSKRNVATSRLAELLGLGDLVARSETATLVDADGKSRSGNLMQTARGQEVKSFVVDQLIDQYTEEMAHTDNIFTFHPFEANMDDKVTPEFMQSLMSLQVLDNLAAQIDRHASNYFAEIKDGKLGRVQGIDNDLSFTSETLDWEAGQTNRVGHHGKNILDQDGNLMVPYMDKALADRLTALDESVLRDVMADVLEPRAIDALCIRFTKIKRAVQKDQEKNSGRYLERDEDWGRQEVFDTLRNHIVEDDRGEKDAGNYVANFLHSAQMSDMVNNGTLNLNAAVDWEFRHRIAMQILREAQDLGDEGKAKEYLAAHGAKPNVLAYLEATGQLLEGPDLLKHLPSNQLEDSLVYFYVNQWNAAHQ